jgi:pyruvate dehydrogenase E2 component (dihydrolipoamide acetyltransferase)
MMASPILMPKQGNTVEECVLTAWLKQVGDAVAVGDIVAEIETDKASFEVEASAAGQMLAHFYEEGDLVPILVNMCVVGEPGEDVEAFRPDGASAPAAEPVAEVAAPVAEVAAAAPVAEPAPVAELATDNAPLSPRARRFVKEHPFQVGAISGSGAGGRIMEKDVETAYQNAPRLSPVAAAMQVEGVEMPAQGTGVGGMIRSGDMGQTAPAPEAALAAPATPVQEVTVTKLSNIRKIISTRMTDSLSQLAQYTLNTCADATKLLELRQRIKANSETLDLGNININDMVMCAAVKALKFHPELNAEFKDGAIYQYSSVNLGFACDTPRGLMVPVLHGADKMSLRELAETGKSFARQAQDGKLSPDYLVGGTFTISSVGSLGVTSFTPVINAPQVAILGICATELKPVRRNGEVVFTEHVQLSLTLDHRIIDGGPGARYLRTLKNIIENFDLVGLAG